MKKTLLTINCFLLFFSMAFSQSMQSFKKNEIFAGIGWLKNVNSSENKAFVENAGQFDDIASAKNKGILYQLEDNNMQVSFTSKGIIYLVSTQEKVSDREWEKYAEKNHFSSGEENEKNEAGKDRYIPKTSIVEMNWIGANSTFEIVPHELTGNYYNYYRPDIDKDKVFGNVKGFKKITYKNVYPFVDVEYTIHPEEGIKYSYILHPGADPSAIKMNYTGANIKADATNNLQFITSAGNITEHKPLTYTGNKTSGKIIESEFELIGKNTIGFKLANANKIISETTVIDPWQVGPAFPASGYTPNDIAVDGAANVLVYSFKPGTAPFGTSGQRIDKYNSAGVLQWTFDLSANAAYTGYQGDVAADPSGNIYATIGLGKSSTAWYNTIKINPAGTALIWGTSTGSTGSNGMYETWTIAFNCDYTQFYQSGGGRRISGTTYFNVSVAEPVNIATGAEGAIIENDSLGDIYDSYYAPNSMIYHLASDSNAGCTRTGLAASGAHNTLVCLNPATGARLFRVQTGYSYIDGDNKAPGSVGLNAIASSCLYLYTMNGAKLDRWNATTGAHYNQVTITGGSTTGGAVNSGILTDKCGNVYVGANGKIYVYDPALNLINTISGLPGVVFDMAWKNSSNTDILVCGGTSTTTTFLADVAVPACVLPNQVTIAPTQPASCGGVGSATATATFCGAPYTYTWSPSGGNTATASNLSPGTYTVTVASSISCPYSYVETQTITINAFSGSLYSTETHTNLVCNGVCAGNATVTPTGGTAPYTYAWFPNGGNSASASGLCAGNYTVTITDNGGCSIKQTVAITQPSALSAVLTQTNSCTGFCNGTASVSASGGTPGYTYTWTPGGGNTAMASSLCAGNYTITVNDNNLCSTTSTVAIASIPIPIVTVNSATICSGNTATLTASGATTYSWSTGAITNTITASPASTTSYTVTGSTAGCSASAVGSITMVPDPTVTVTSATVCAASTGTLTANGATTYSWSTGAATDTIMASPASTTSYTVTGTTSGCSASAVGTITVLNPVITVNSATICPGGTTILTAGGANTYSWSPSTGLSSAIGASVTCTSSTTTIYTVTGTSVEGCTATAAAATVTVANITPTVNSPTICAGNSATLTATGGTTYSWSPGTGLSSTTGASVTANPTVSTTYTITAVSSGCPTTTVTSVVSVNPLPTVTVNAATICMGGSSTLNAGGANTYSWSPGTALSSTNGASVTANPTSTISYTITGTDANGCVNTATTTVTVNPLPIITVNGALICAGGSTTLNAGGAATYSWSPGTGLSSSTGSTVTASPVSTTQYTIVGMDANGCVNSDTVIVTVITNPTVNIASSTICIGSATTLTANGAITYSWSPGTALSSTTGSVVTASPTTTTVYTITGTVGTCTAVTTATVTVNPLPIVTINTTTICAGGSSILNASGANTYSWGPGTGLNSTSGASVVANPTVTTTYTVTGTDANGCANTATSVVTANSTLVATPAICMVSADDSSTNNIIYFDKTVYTNMDSFIVYREISSNVYSRIGAVSKDSLSQFIDINRSVGPANGDPKTGYYHYKIQVRDTCGNYSALSPYHTSVYLIDNHNGSFSWNTYDVENQTTPVANFNLLRDSVNTGNWRIIGTVAGTATTMNDPLYATYQFTGNWRVEATGFNCTPTTRMGNNNNQSAIVKSKSNITNNRTTGSGQLSTGSDQVLIYPNPANDELTVSFSKNCNNCQLEIINILGETVKTISVTSSESKINIAEMQSGVYFVKVISNGNSFLQKLIVQH